MAGREPASLKAADYAVFIIMLMVSAGIGIFFAYRDRKSKAGVQGYLMGGRNMSYIPVSISLSLSFVSAVTILGIPAEMYIFGSMYCWLLFGCVMICVLPVTEIFIPIFYRLGITSSFEYLQLRYNYAVRLLATAAYIFQNIMYIGIMIFAPALALNSVTSLNLWASIFSIGLVCTFYTTLGGLKAVIWTDVFQGFIVLLGTAATLFASASKAGGWDRVWKVNYESGRIDFGRFDFDVRVRHSFWSISIGLGFLWMSIFGTSQSQVQRYLCCRTEKDAKKGVVISMVVSGLIFLLTVFTGFVMYAYFADCDPLLNKEVSAPDQLLPYMVLDVFRDHPGLPGLFVASVFSGCLSTVSSGINAMACVTVEDFIRPFVTWEEKTLTWLSKGLVFMYGLLCIGFACLSSLLGGVLQASLSAIGIVGGPLLGIFSLGIVFPCGNSIGVTVGMISGMILTTWIYIGSQAYPPLPQFTRPKPRDISGCPDPSSIVFPIPPDPASRPNIADDFYSVSYAYYTAIGYATTIGVGLLVSLCTRGYQTRKEVNPRLIRPLLDHRIFRWLPEKFRRFMWCGVEHDKVNAHEVIKVPEQPPEYSLKRRWSSRERTSSLRLSRRHWREGNAQRVARDWRMKHEKRVEMRELMNNQEEELNNDTVPAKLDLQNETNGNSRTSGKKTSSLRPQRKSSKSKQPERGDSVKSGIPSVWI
ncbi:sodium-coupled monocarboxylate transporter 2-like isoform X1 [Styela clava]